MNKSIIIDGYSIAKEVMQDATKDLQQFINNTGITPGLAVIVLGNDHASHIYVKRKKEAAASIGINSSILHLPAHTSTNKLKAKVQELNNNSTIHGILVQLPLPKHINTIEIINSVSPSKDVDGFTTENVGKLITSQTKNALYPCTPQGCMHLIKTVESSLAGANAVVVGRSNIVGRPMSSMLMNEDCTVTTIHALTKNPIDIAKTADILVTATGVPGLITKKWVNKNTIVIDVGISKNPVSGKSSGDVDFENVKNTVRAITPVPKGVGPMTVAYLIKNTIKAAINKDIL